MHPGSSEANLNRPIEDQIGEIILQRHENMLQVISAELNNTFLAIGQQLQGYEDNQIADLASRLETSFGTFFTISKLHNIKHVVAAMPDVDELAMVTDILDWNQLSAFSNLDGKESRLSFIQNLFNIKTEKSLSIQSSQKLGKPNLFKPEYYKAIETLKKDFFTKARKSPLGTSQNEILATLQLFMKATTNSSILNEDSSHHRLDESILTLIEKFNLRINSWLNSFLNFSFLEIGKNLNRLLLEDKNPESLMNISTGLIKLFGKPFDVKNLTDARRFAALWRNQDKTLELTSLVTWSHIRILQLENANYSLFYARLAASNHWSPETLANKIQDETTKRQYETEPAYSLTVTKTANRVKKGHTIIQKNTAQLEKPLQPFPFSISDNPYFPLISVEH